MRKTNMSTNPPQTFVRIFRPWENDNYTMAEQPKPSEAESRDAQNSIVKTENNSFNDSLPAASTSTFSGSESDRECASSNSSCSKSSRYERQPMAAVTSNTSTLMTNDTATQIPYTNPYFYGSLEGHTPTHVATHFPHTINTSYVLPSASNFYYAAAAAAATNSDLPSTSSAAYALNPYAFNFMDREYARVIVEDAQLKAANARKQRPKKFKCTVCDVAFSNNGQLKGHIRIHTGERPFKCDFETCDKTFTRNEELTRHKRIHTGLKPYPCPVCGKCFGRRDHLSKHLKTHLPKATATMYLSMYPDFFGL